MSSFLKTSFIHDEAAPSESLILLLKRSFSQHHLHFFLVFFHSPPLSMHPIVCFAVGLHQRQTGIAGNVSIYKLLITVGLRTVWTCFSDHRFSEKVQLSRHRGPHRTKKKISHAICLSPVRVRKVVVHCNSESTVMFSCTLALGRLATTAPACNERSTIATSWWGHARTCPCPGALCEGRTCRR